MEYHPLLQELLLTCSANNINSKQAFAAFEVYLRLSEVKKIASLVHFFNKTLEIFYFSGKKEKTDVASDIYIPIDSKSYLTPEKMAWIQKHICENQKQFYLIIRDEDSSSTCYIITNNLMKPDSLELSKTKKEVELKKSKCDLIFKRKGKILYSEAQKARIK